MWAILRVYLWLLWAYCIHSCRKLPQYHHMVGMKLCYLLPITVKYQHFTRFTLCVRRYLVSTRACACLPYKLVLPMAMHACERLLRNDYNTISAYYTVDILARDWLCPRASFVRRRGCVHNHVGIFPFVGILKFHRIRLWVHWNRKSAAALPWIPTLDCALIIFQSLFHKYGSSASWLMTFMGKNAPFCWKTPARRRKHTYYFHILRKCDLMRFSSIGPWTMESGTLV